MRPGDPISKSVYNFGLKRTAKALVAIGQLALRFLSNLFVIGILIGRKRSDRNSSGGNRNGSSRGVSRSASGRGSGGYGVKRYGTEPTPYDFKRKKHKLNIK